MMTMTSFLNRFMFWKKTERVSPSGFNNDPEKRLAIKLKPYEKYISEIENVIMWTNPIISISWIVAVHLVFWGFVSLEWRFFGIVGTVLLVLNVFEGWSRYVWPEIKVPGNESPQTPELPSPRVEAVSKHITCCYSRVVDLVLRVKNLRSQVPGKFCCGGVVGSGCLLLLARSVSGLMLVYTLLMAVLVGPALITHCVPPALKLTVTHHVACLSHLLNNCAVNDGSDDEYLPETNSEDLALLTRASNVDNNPYENQESTSDLMSGLAMMPSHEEDSLATISDLEPLTSLPLDHSDDSDSNPDDHLLQFQSGHFNGESSSEEEVFTKDLVFTDGDQVDAAAPRGLSSLITQAVSRNLVSSVGLLAAVVRPSQTSIPAVRNRRETDSDLEDFEVIDRDEINS